MPCAVTIPMPWDKMPSLTFTTIACCFLLGGYYKVYCCGLIGSDNNLTKLPSSSSPAEFGQFSPHALRTIQLSSVVTNLTNTDGMRRMVRIA